MSKITAYKLSDYGEIALGNPDRNWMDMSQRKFAYGCLPLVISNQLGWDVICGTTFRAIWNGRPSLDSIKIEFKEESDSNQQVVSHFGMGILTFHPGFLFKTELGTNLMIKGAPNFIKDAIQPLEAIVETDWLPLTFTMNWKFTRDNVWVEFFKGDPIARILPYPRNYIESFQPEISRLENDPVVQSDFHRWSQDRANHNEALNEPNPVKLMEKDYFKGQDKDGKRIEYHQKKIVLNSFNEKQ